MSYIICHLTDLHLQSEQSCNSIFSKAQALKQAISSEILVGDVVIMVVSGDIASTGKKKEYEHAVSLFSDIEHYINEEKKIQVNWAMAPGNHDCDLENTDSIRDTLIDAIKNGAACPRDTLDRICVVQNNYNEFEALFSLTEINPIEKHKTIDTKEGKILIVLNNTAWMSRKHETAGSGIIPPEYISYQIDNSQYLFTISVFHHPINWLNPDNAAFFRNRLRNTSEFVIMGHEHEQDQVSSCAPTWNIEQRNGMVLQDSKNDENSGFSIYKINLSDNLIQDIHFRWNAKGYYDSERMPVSEFKRNKSRKEKTIEATNVFLQQLDDIGFSVHHPYKENPTLSEIFCCPDILLMDSTTMSEISPKVCVNSLCDILKYRYGFIMGNKDGGKSTIAKMLCLHYIKCTDCIPVLCNGKSFISRKDERIEEVITENFCDQYGEKTDIQFRQLEKKRKVILIDEFDKCQMNYSAKQHVIQFLINNYGSIYLFASIGLDMTETYTIVNVDSESLQLMKVMSMGNSKRHELVSKWYVLGKEDFVDQNELDAKVKNATTIINEMVSRGVIPAIPLYIIIVLQQLATGNASTYDGSRLGYFYETIVNRNLALYSRNNQSEDSICRELLSFLAYSMLCKYKNRLSYEELHDMIEIYRNEFAVDIDISIGSFIKDMCTVYILKKSPDGYFSFKYPYIYYYFCGRYISRNLAKKEVYDKLVYLIDRLYVEDYANIVVFVCQFSNNPIVIELVINNAEKILDSKKEFDFINCNTLIRSVDQGLENYLDKVVFCDDKVDEHKKEELKRLDESHIDDGEVKEQSTNIDDISENQLVAELNSGMQTIGVLGQIHRGYPGSIEKPLKIRIVKSVRALGMRILSLIMEDFEYESEGFIPYCTDRILQEHSEESRDKIESLIRHFLVSFMLSLTEVIVHHISSSISSSSLITINKKVLAEDNSIAGKLIMVDSCLNCLGQSYADQVVNMYADLKKLKNNFAANLLRGFVYNYLYMNRCSKNEFNKLCSEFLFNSQHMLTDAKIGSINR